jgi:hypothetical protein
MHHRDPPLRTHTYYQLSFTSFRDPITTTLQPTKTDLHLLSQQTHAHVVLALYSA